MKGLMVSIALCGFALLSCQSGSRNIIFDEKTNQDILFGYATPEVFLKDPFAVWYNLEYTSYEPNVLFIDSLTQQLNSIKITIVLGTWCGDCRREVPRFIKILNTINFPIDQLTIIGVARDKVCEKANIHEGDIGFVPTFIIHNKDKEIGRIIESPVLSLEEDLLRIVENS